MSDSIFTKIEQAVYDARTKIMFNTFLTNCTLVVIISRDGYRNLLKQPDQQMYYGCNENNDMFIFGCRLLESSSLRGEEFKVTLDIDG